MKYEFKYDEVADVLFISSPNYKWTQGIIKKSNGDRFNIDRFTKEILGGRLIRFSGRLKKCSQRIEATNNKRETK